MANTSYINLRDINVANITFRGPTKGKIGINSYVNYGGNSLQFVLPLMRAPFGATKYDNNLGLDLSFHLKEEKDQSGEYTPNAQAQRLALQRFSEIDATVVQHVLENSSGPNGYSKAQGLDADSLRKLYSPIVKVSMDSNGTPYPERIHLKVLTIGPDAKGNVRPEYADGKTFLGVRRKTGPEPLVFTDRSDKVLSINADNWLASIPKGSFVKAAVEPSMIFMNKTTGLFSCSWRLIGALIVDTVQTPVRSITLEDGELWGGAPTTTVASESSEAEATDEEEAPSVGASRN